MSTERAPNGQLVVLSGPSGAGKTTICDRLLEEPGMVRAVTATTRSPREGEVEGVDYYFLTEEEFRRDIDAGRFLEHAEVHGRLYGTPVAPLEKEMAAGRTVLLSIDVQGAEELMRRNVAALFGFIAPPSVEELERRLVARGADDGETIALRMQNARKELDCKDRYDFTVVNDDLDRAVDEILARIQHARERT